MPLTLRKRKPGRWKDFDDFSGKPFKRDGRWYVSGYGFCQWKRGLGGWYVDGARNLDLLRREMAHLVTYRGTPDDIPKPRPIWIPVHLDGDQRALYRQVEAELFGDIRDLRSSERQSKMIQNIFVIMGRMRQICAMSVSAFSRGKIESAQVGAKQRWFFDHLWPNVGQGDKVLVFSEWTRATGEMVDLCQARDIPAAHYHGGLTAKRRNRLIDQWNAGEVQVMACSPSGYNSVNLHQAFGQGDTAYTYMLDVPQWYKIFQRIGRTARRGMKAKPVVIIPYAKGSIEIDWMKFASGIVVPNFERLFGQTLMSEVYAEVRRTE